MPAVSLTAEQLMAQGLSIESASRAIEITGAANPNNRNECWQRLCAEVLGIDSSYDLLQIMFAAVYGNEEAPPAWFPDEGTIAQANVTKLQRQLNCVDYKQLHEWSVTNKKDFWNIIIKELDIYFDRPYSAVADFSKGPEEPIWFCDARFNIANSCFGANAEDTAIIYQPEGGSLSSLSYGELESLTNKVANGLTDLGMVKGDAIAVDIPMTMESVAIYLGIVKMGGAVVSIADSLASVEVEKRLTIANAKAIFTQDVMLRAGKQLALYMKLKEIDIPQAIVLPAEDKLSVTLQDKDISWSDFLSNNDRFDSVECTAEDICNILFSSGTTGDPKAIPWLHATPVKCAADGYLHHDLHAGDVVAWPTNIGWMMGPWLIFAGLINKCSIALYYGAPVDREFGKFVQNAKVNMLGLVPSMVKRWIQTDCMKGLDWSSIKCFSSTGESSNPQDYLWLMARGGFKPVIEYCGGTEIGGGYFTGTVVQPASPSTFTTPALGLDIMILDEQGKPSDGGELYVVPPSVGLSTSLLNKNHHEVYFAGVPEVEKDFKGGYGTLLQEQFREFEHPPTIRRHGDEAERLPNGYFRALGRADDTMNLGGIKTSSVEIERLLDLVEGVKETAAIAVSPERGGPSQLVICTVLKEHFNQSTSDLKQEFQAVIKSKLNPLFKIHEVVKLESLPRTASNKVMRRVLRNRYSERALAE